MTKKWIWLLVSLLLLAPGGAFAADSSAPYPILTGVKFFSHTLNDNKDFDTSLSVYLFSKGAVLGEARNADRNVEYRDGSVHSFPLTMNRNLGWISKAALVDGTNFLRVVIKANGNDNWVFIPSAIFYFSDGSWIRMEWYPTALNSRGSSTVYRDFPLLKMYIR